MGNIDFGLDAKFSIYVVALLLVGVVMLAVVSRGGNTQKSSERLWGAVVGIAALGYGIYLGWIFDGGTYQLFWYVFILPVLLLIGLFKAEESPATDLVPDEAPASAPPADAPAHDGDAAAKD